MLLLGIDLGTSSIKVSVADASTRKVLVSVQYPETEVEIIALHTGWSEQEPELWWHHIKQAIIKCNSSGSYNPHDIAAIGIAYQMHGLVLVDKHQNVLRNSIIWSDSRAVLIGEEAFKKIGKQKCLSSLLNSPANFTASKLSWVKENEAELFDSVYKFLLPGDFIAMKFTGEISTTISALSEGIFWDFENGKVSEAVLDHFNFKENIIPPISPVFSDHAKISLALASELNLSKHVTITYKAGDQLNNAFALNVNKPGEVAATAGTSGVIYAVTDKLVSDSKSRINSFAHVNHSSDHPGIGVLLCINGCGIFNRWMKNAFNSHKDYSALNELAAKVSIGSDGLFTLPFGNGAERMLNNIIPGAHLRNVDFNIHTPAHLMRATQEGIAFAFRYGLDIMRENGIEPTVIRAGIANLFQSEVFCTSFVEVTNTPLELFKTDGSVGAALAAGLGNGFYKNEDEIHSDRKPVKIISPQNNNKFETLYQEWKSILEMHIMHFQKN